MTLHCSTGLGYIVVLNRVADRFMLGNDMRHASQGRQCHAACAVNLDFDGLEELPDAGMIGNGGNRFMKSIVGRVECIQILPLGEEFLSCKNLIKKIDVPARC